MIETYFVFILNINEPVMNINPFEPEASELNQLRFPELISIFGGNFKSKSKHICSVDFWTAEDCIIHSNLKQDTSFIILTYYRVN